MSDENPVDTQDEFAALEVHDDAIIGKAFVWSLAVFGAMGVFGLALWGVLALQGEEEEVIIQKDVAPPKTLVADVAILPDVAFRDITEQAGLTAPHISGAEGGKLLPETMGGGAAFLDANGDGHQEVQVRVAVEVHKGRTGAPG